MVYRRRDGRRRAPDQSSNDEIAYGSNQGTRTSSFAIDRARLYHPDLTIDISQVEDAEVPLLDPPGFGGWVLRVWTRAGSWSGRPRALRVFPFPAAAGDRTVPPCTCPVKRERDTCDSLPQGARGQPIPSRLPGLRCVYKITQFGTYACRTHVLPGKKSNHSWRSPSTSTGGPIRSWTRRPVPTRHAPVLHRRVRGRGVSTLRSSTRAFERSRWTRGPAQRQTGPLTVDHTQFLGHPTFRVQRRRTSWPNLRRLNSEPCSITEAQQPL